MQLTNLAFYIIGNNPDAVAQKAAASGLHITDYAKMWEEVISHADTQPDGGVQFLRNVLNVPIRWDGLYLNELSGVHQDRANGLLVDKVLANAEEKVTPVKSKTNNPYMMDLRPIAMVTGIVTAIVLIIFLIKKL